jgi:hypothetical protein
VALTFRSQAVTAHLAARLGQQDKDKLPESKRFQPDRNQFGPANRRVNSTRWPGAAQKIWKFK